MSTAFAIPDVQTPASVSLYKPMPEMGIKQFVSAVLSTFRVNWPAFLSLGVGYLILTFITGMVYVIVVEFSNHYYSSLIFWGTTILIIAVNWLITIIAQISVYIIADGASEKNKESFEEILAKVLSWSQIWHFILTSIFYYLTVLFGFMLLIIPGIIWSIQFIFAPMISVFEGVGPRLAFSRSSSLTAGIKGNIFGLSIGISIVLLLGVYLPFTILIGLIATALGLPFFLEWLDMPVPVWASVITMIRNVVWQGAVLIFTVLLYKSVKLEKQAQN